MNRRSFLFGTVATLTAAVLPSTGLPVTLIGKPGRGFTYGGSVTGRWSADSRMIEHVVKMQRMINEVRDMRQAEQAGSGRALPLIIGPTAQADRAAGLDFAEIERRVVSCAPQLFLETYKKDREERTQGWWKKYLNGDWA